MRQNAWQVFNIGSCAFFSDIMRADKRYERILQIVILLRRDLRLRESCAGRMDAQLEGMPVGLVTNCPDFLKTVQPIYINMKRTATHP